MLDAGRGSSGCASRPWTTPGSYDHLLIGTSLPWLLPPLVHDAEAWNAALCRGERGRRAGRGSARSCAGAADLEHWAAFPDSFDAADGADRARPGAGPDAPATVCVLSGDVHHAYIAEPALVPTAGRPPDARVLQLTCSPVHNSIPASIRSASASAGAGWAGRSAALLARHGRVGAAADRLAQDRRTLVRQPADDPDAAWPESCADIGSGQGEGPREHSWRRFWSVR